jgi:hypothetical protein
MYVFFEGIEFRSWRHIQSLSQASHVIYILLLHLVILDLNLSYNKTLILNIHVFVFKNGKLQSQKKNVKLGFRLMTKFYGLTQRKQGFLSDQTQIEEPKQDCCFGWLVGYCHCYQVLAV